MHSDGLIDKCVGAVAQICVGGGRESWVESGRDAHFGGDAQDDVGDDEGDCGSVNWEEMDEVTVCGGGTGVAASGLIVDAGRAMFFGRGAVGLIEVSQFGLG